MIQSSLYQIMEHCRKMMTPKDHDIIFKNIFFNLCDVYVSVNVCHICSGACGGQKKVPGANVTGVCEPHNMSTCN